MLTNLSFSLPGFMWLDDLQRTVQTHISKGATLIVAVSGGGDSVALLHGLHSMRETQNLRLVVTHLDHGLRIDSAADAAFVGSLALQLGCMCLREQINVGQWAVQEGRNIEDTARQLRYRLLESSARAVGATAIVLAHTQDDQAETVLMHLLRGAGLEGLSGMAIYDTPAIKGAATPLFRPLLGVDRATLRDWLTANGHSWCEDSTNMDTHRFRSAVRHRLLPALEEMAPRLRERLARTANVLAADADLIQALTEQAWERLATHRNHRICFARSTFLQEPHGIQRRLIRRAYASTQTTDHQLSADHITRALALIDSGKADRQMSLPGGILLTIAHDGVWVGAPFVSAPWAATVLPQRGTVKIGERTFTIRRAKRAELPSAWNTVPAALAFLDLEAISLPLIVRPPAADEEWQPFGMDGKWVRLRKWLSDQKVPRHQRETLPIVTDDTGQILWVVGRRTSHYGRVTSETTKILRIEVTE